MRLRTSINALLLTASFLSVILPIHAYNFDACKWDRNSLTYWNDAGGVARRPIELAVQAWYDVPVPFQFGPAASLSSADIVSREQSGPFDAPGATGSLNCSSRGFITPPVQIFLYDSFRDPYDPGHTILLSSLAEDNIVGIAAHELGHALGLAHSSNERSLMFGYPYGSPQSAYDRYHIFVPVHDDILGLHNLYGYWWSPDTQFGGTALSGVSYASGTLAPITLRVSTPASGSYAQVYKASGLPSSGIAIMMAVVAPATLYRMHIGWENCCTNPTGIYNRYGTIELDNDGIKYAGVFLGGIEITTFYRDPPLRAYHFLELVLMTVGGNPNSVRATAYAFSGDLDTPAGFLGSFHTDRVDSWTGGHYFDAAVWTDSSSSPASDYQLVHFWNIQGDYCAKFICGSGGGSVAYGSLITMVNGSRVPVQNLDTGDMMLGYDVATGHFVPSEIRSIIQVDTSNMLIINTDNGIPVRVDANFAQTLWAKRTDGSYGWTPVTELREGDYLFYQDATWRQNVGIEFAPEGQHVMYDILATAPYFADGYLDPQQK